MCETVPLPPVHGKFVLHRTRPYCQKGWGLAGDPEVAPPGEDPQADLK